MRSKKEIWLCNFANKSLEGIFSVKPNELEDKNIKIDIKPK